VHQSEYDASNVLRDVRCDREGHTFSYETLCPVCGSKKIPGEVGPVRAWFGEGRSDPEQRVIRPAECSSETCEWGDVKP
jgi:hypothetical protein